MDFTQQKLTKAEWEAIEVRLPEKELEILKLVYDYSTSEKVTKTVIPHLILGSISSSLMLITLKNINYLLKTKFFPTSIKNYFYKWNTIVEFSKN